MPRTRRAPFGPSVLAFFKSESLLHFTKEGQLVQFYSLFLIILISGSSYMKHLVLTYTSLTLYVGGNFVEIGAERNVAANPSKHENSLQVWAFTRGT